MAEYHYFNAPGTDPAETHHFLTPADPPSPPTSALLKLGNYTFEVDKDSNIRPYGDKPTLDHITMAQSLSYLRPLLYGREGKPVNNSSVSYTPLSNSKVYHGVYNINPQEWMGNFLSTHDIPYTPTQVKPDPITPGGWLVGKPDGAGGSDWERYK